MPGLPPARRITKSNLALQQGPRTLKAYQGFASDDPLMRSGLLGPVRLEFRDTNTIRVLPQADGYRGIWYYNQPSKDEYRYKYSGGMATYPQQHEPIAVYCPEVNKTFFVYGGTTAREAADRQEVLHIVSWFDHATGTVPRPRILLNKHTSDAHDNPTLAVDADGYLWVFSPSHGTARPSYIHRSTKPYSIDEFERVFTGNFSYPQAWYLKDKGFVFLHTRYGGAGLDVKAQRCLGWVTSRDGREWSSPHALAAIAQGDYQISWPHGGRLATALDFHPSPLGLNARANIYYLETADFGATWSTAADTPVALPLTNAQNAALIYDSVRESRLVYLKDLNFDAKGRPVILFLTSQGLCLRPAKWTAPMEYHSLDRHRVGSA